MSSEPIPAEYHHELTSKRGDLTRLWACWWESLPLLAARRRGGERGGARRAALRRPVVVAVHLALPLLLLAAQPFVEWVIHKYLLHLKPLSIAGRRVELYGSIQHRRHHRSPSDLDRGRRSPSRS